ncbi:MAG TPA: hypothetical protein VGJ25_11150 [Gaiellaceae bacterium]
MAPLPAERTGVLVIRAWIESGGENALRARITSTLDVTEQGEGSTVASTPAAITEAVAEWLRAFLGAASLTLA